jgi:hypothetical protein
MEDLIAMLLDAWESISQFEVLNAFETATHETFPLTPEDLFCDASASLQGRRWRNSFTRN